jgi:thiol-disulfide isomerase/thioredoxin
MKRSISILLLATIVSAAAAEETVEPDHVGQLVGAFTNRFREPFSKEWSAVDKRLRKGPDANGCASDLLRRKSDVVSSPQAQQLLDKLVSQKKDILAAELLLRIALAKNDALAFPNHPPRVVTGQLLVDDQKTKPELVKAQMEILEDGFFATEIGSFDQPLCFRAAGYQDLDVPLTPFDVDVADIGQVTLKPLSAEQRATIKGKIVVDGATDFKSVGLTLDVSMPPINTPSRGYRPRREWPKQLFGTVSETGEFVVEGLNPTGYDLLTGAKDHLSAFKQVTLTAGKETDVGTLRLMYSDLKHYVGKPEPSTEPLAWETDFATAAKRAETEGKPLMVMMTATWCGPCKMLEKETLNDPWIRLFLSRFVIIKAYEDKEVESKYGLSGYPTLVFADSSGKAAYKCTGYKPVLGFASDCARAFNALSQSLPEELQTLIDKEVIKIE